MGAPDCYKYFVDACIFWIKEYKTRFNDYTFFISLCVDFHMRLLVIFIIGRSSVFAIFSLGSIRRDTKCCCIQAKLIPYLNVQRLRRGTRTASIAKIIGFRKR